MDPNTITAIAAVVVAALALCVSLAESSRARRHNRLSVAPKLRVAVRSTLDKDVRLVIYNAGLGPAVIRSFYVSLDDGPRYRASQWEPGQHWVQAMDAESQRLGFTYVSQTAYPDEMVDKGGCVDLLHMVGSGRDEDSRRAARRFLRRLSITVGYKSMYRECFTMYHSAYGKKPEGEVAAP